MASMLYAAGQKYNLLERGTVTVSGTADPVYGIANLSDGRTSKPMRFSGLGATERIIVDTNQLVNGDLETWPLTGWTANLGGGTGTVTQTTTGSEVHGDTSAAKLSGGTNGVNISQTITARAGEQRRLDFWIKLNNSGHTGKARIKNEDTGRYLNSSLAWQSTATFVFTHTGTTAYTNLAATYTVESLFKCGADTVTLTITFSAIASSDVMIDDVGDWASVQLMSLHGLKIQDRCKVTWEYSATNGSYGNALVAGDHETGFSADQKPNLYLKQSALVATARWNRVTFENDTVSPTSAREVGEMVLAQVTSMTRGYDWSPELGVMQEDIANESGDGDMQVYVKCRWPRRTLGLQWKFVSDAQMREARDDLWGRAKGRAYPLLVVPDDSAGFVMLMRSDPRWSVQRSFTTFYTGNDLSFSELPFVSTAL